MPIPVTDNLASLRGPEAPVPVTDAEAKLMRYGDLSDVPAAPTHGSLPGLGADDHPQYLLVDGSRQVSGRLGINTAPGYELDLGAAEGAGRLRASEIGIGAAPNAASAINVSFTSGTKEIVIDMDTTLNIATPTQPLYGIRAIVRAKGLPTTDRTITGVRCQAYHSKGDGGRNLNVWGGDFIGAMTKTPLDTYTAGKTHQIVGGYFGTAYSGSGTNPANLTLRSGYFADPLVSGTVTGTVVKRAIYVGGDAELLADVHLSGASGTKLGTAASQKLGFWGATPVVQPAANADTSGATLAGLETEVNQIKQLLRDVGLMAAA